jgi:glycosyltransferase involved in cell wall biosynthesis
MICGSCIHDNTLAQALTGLGHEVALIPTYTPIRTDEQDVSLDRVFFGAVNVYLQQKSGLFRRAPRFLTRWMDRPGFLRWVTKGAHSTDARLLGEMTVAMLEGEEGPNAAEVEALVAWLRDEYRPDVVHLTNSMFLGSARRLREELGVPVVVSVQGEDLFLGQLVEPWRRRVFELLVAKARDADAFVAPSRYYAQVMTELLEIPAERMHVVPLGILPHDELDDPRPAARDGGRRLGFLARICPEKGFHHLVEAFEELAARPGHEDVELHAAGYLGPADREYFEGQVKRLEAAGLGERFRYHGEVDLAGKHTFLQSLDLFSVPTVYHEAKGISILEAMAAGVAVVQPAHGSFPEIIEATGGGVLVEPESTPALADALASLLADPDRRRAHGRAGRAGVLEHYRADDMAVATAGLYARLVQSAQQPASRVS